MPDQANPSKSLNCYVDTRGSSREPIPFTQALIEGIAPSGGLYVPQTIPHLSLDEIVSLASMPYRERAAFVYGEFDVDLDDATIDECMRASYGSNFDTPEICPIDHMSEKMHMLQLWHGPTSAFKDMALQCLPNFFQASAKKLKSEGKLDHSFLILVATSGDTGKAALEGFKGTDGVCVGVMYPDGGVSDIQRKQMVTTTGSNVYVWAVRGNFDDCQTAAKRVFGDADFAAELMEAERMALSSANSINWGRLLPQIVYYISSYSEMVKGNVVEPGSPMDVCVPTGNFGNILAAWYAKQMGTPIGTLLCASNENRVLTDFIETGIYDIQDRPFMLTPSPSMDILVSSNLERQLFELTGRDGEKISNWMADLNEKKRFEVGSDVLEKIKGSFKGESVSSNECLETIRNVFERHGRLIDPHTAVAFAAACKADLENPVLVASTAHWAKFGADVYRALHDINAGEPLPDAEQALTGCQLNELIADETGIHDIPSGLSGLDEAKVRFTKVIDSDKDDVEDAVLEFAMTQH